MSCLVGSVRLIEIVGKRAGEAGGRRRRLDAKDNIYLADMVKPPDRSFPEFFDGKLTPPSGRTNSQNARYYASYRYGSIVKFPPTGAWK